MWKLVQTPDHVSNHVSNKQLWEPFERQTVNTRAETLLDCAYGPLDLADMAVSGDGIHLNGTNAVTDAFELLVGVYILHDEATVTVKLNHSCYFFQNCFGAAVSYGSYGAETNASGDGV
jgi:hypothetical protein